MKQQITALVAGAALVAGVAVGCAGTDGENEPDDIERTAMEMTVELDDKVDVAGIRFSIFEHQQDDPQYVQEHNLEEMTLPEAMPEFLEDPFDEDSEHLFARHTQPIDTGSWDVMAEPIDEDGQLVDECEPVTAEGVEVEEGETTQVLLVSQCEVTDPEKVLAEPADEGELDAVAALNHPPQITSVQAVPSDELQCPATLELCADVVEPDRDPVVFDWVVLEGPEPLEGPTETVFEEDNGDWHKCVEYVLPDETANYLFELTVWDRFIVDGQLITVEGWYRDQGFGEIESRDTATIPVSVDCPDEEPVIDDKKDKKEDLTDEEKEEKKDEYEEA